MTKDYEIVTRNYYKNQRAGSSTFLTKATTIKSALNKLLTHSNDFRIIVGGQKKIQITIIER